MNLDNKMFIPKTIKVGYNERKDTYTGKLAYIVYIDDKGKLRKEKSWKQWCNQKLGDHEFANEPTDNFVLNKGVGGVGWGGWNARHEYIRVYDPRNFEFEISVANLLFILQECSSIKGKGLEGEFVYAWSGTELVLLPVSSSTYKECSEHTLRQKIKFDKKDLKQGHTYLMKNGDKGMYLGRHGYSKTNYRFKPCGRKHIFLKDPAPTSKWNSPYIAESGLTKIAECISTDIPQDFADKYEEFKDSAYYAEITSLDFVKIKLTDEYMDKTLFVKHGQYYYPSKIRRHPRVRYISINAMQQQVLPEHEQFKVFQNTEPFTPTKTKSIVIPNVEMYGRDGLTIRQDHDILNNLYMLQATMDNNKTKFL